MSLDIDLTTLILIVTIFQGLYLGVLFASGRKWNHPSFLLGLTLFVYSSGLIYDVMQRVQLLELFPALHYIPIKFYYLQAPLAYLTARKVAPTPINFRDYLWFIPAAVELILLVFLFFLPIEVKSILEAPQSEWQFPIFLYRSLWIPFSAVLLFICYRIVQQNRERFLNLVSSSQDKSMRWTMKTCLFGVLFCCCFLTKFFLDEATYATYMIPINAVLILIMVISLGAVGVKLSWIDYDYSAVLEKEVRLESKQIQLNNRGKAKDKEATHSIFIRSLREYIEKHKPYRDPELTIDTLSKAAQISPRQISSVLNQFAGINFNTFINQFRVEEAQRLLRDESYSHLSILGIGFEVGFNSKATFYSVFKKQTGMTPAKWQNPSLRTTN